MLPEMASVRTVVSGVVWWKDVLEPLFVHWYLPKHCCRAFIAELTAYRSPWETSHHCHASYGHRLALI